MHPVQCIRQHRVLCVARNRVETPRHPLETVLETVVICVETVKSVKRGFKLTPSKSHATVSTQITTVSRAVSSTVPTVPTRFLDSHASAHCARSILRQDQEHARSTFGSESTSPHHPLRPSHAAPAVRAPWPDAPCLSLRAAAARCDCAHARRPETDALAAEHVHTHMRMGMMASAGRGYDAHKPDDGRTETATIYDARKALNARQVTSTTHET